MQVVHDLLDGRYLMKPLSQLYLKIIFKFFFNKGKWGHTPSPFGRRIIKLLPKIKVLFNCGVKIIPKYDLWKWVLSASRGTHEQELENFMVDNLSIGNIVLDVGAQLGLTTTILGSIVGNKGKVFSFEPNPNSRRIMNEVLLLNKLSSVVLVPFGVSDKKGKLPFYFEDGGFHSYVSLNKSDKDQDIEVIRLDEFCHYNNLEKIHFIKIDIDGPDFIALKSAEDIIKKFKPILAIEVSHFWRNYGFSFKDLYMFLLEYGYDKFYVAHRKKEYVLEIKALSDLPDHWGEEPLEAINVFAWSSKYNPKVIFPHF